MNNITISQIEKTNEQKEIEIISECLSFLKNSNKKHNEHNK